MARRRSARMSPRSCHCGPVQKGRRARPRTQGVAPTPVQTPFGIRIQNVEVDIDEKTLTEIASITGGQYFRAEDNEGLSNIYDEIDEMEKYLINVQNVTRKQELYLPFALLALALMFLELILRRTFLRTIP